MLPQVFLFRILPLKIVLELLQNSSSVLLLKSSATSHAIMALPNLNSGLTKEERELQKIEQLNAH